MISHSSVPSIVYPCIVQVNYSDGNIAFYQAKDIFHAEKIYVGKIVAIFKPKK